MSKLGLKYVFLISSVLFLGVFLASSAYAYSFPTVSFSVTPPSIKRGETIALVWSSTNAEYCVASGGWHGFFFTQGAETLKPEVTTEYSISCSGFGGSSSSRVTAVVTDAPVISPNPAQVSSGVPAVNLVLTPASITKGGQATISWVASGANVCSAFGGWSGIKPTSGSGTVNPSVTTTYTLTCLNGTNSTTDSKTLTVNGNVSSFKAACVASPNTTFVGSPIIFAAGATGGNGPLSYEWRGDITGSDLTRSISFNTPGTKTATVIVTDSIGKKAEASCSAEVNSRKAAGFNTTPKKPLVQLVATGPKPDYDALCRDKGYIKASDIELAQKNKDANTAENQEKEKRSLLGYLAFGGGNMPPGLGLFLLMITIILATFGGTMLFLRFKKRSNTIPISK